MKIIKPLQAFFPKLKNSCSAHNRWYWVYSDNISKEDIKNISDVIESNKKSPHITFLKRKKKKNVFTYRTNQNTFFIKDIKPLRPKKKIRATLRLIGNRFGYTGPVTECYNTIKAKSIIGFVPDVYAFGEQRSVLGIIKQQAIVLETLSNYHTLRRALEKANTGKKKLFILKRAGKIIQTLYNNKLAHVDVGLENIFLSLESPVFDKTIDFEYLIEFAGDRPDILALYYSHLIQDNRYINDDVYDSFVMAEFKAIYGPKSLPDELISLYKYFRKHILRRRERMKIVLHGFHHFRP